MRLDVWLWQGRRTRRGGWALLLALLWILLAATGARAAEERFPPPEFRSNYIMPHEQLVSPARGVAAQVDILLVVFAGGLAASLITAAFTRRVGRILVGAFLVALATYGGWYLGTWIALHLNAWRAGKPPAQPWGLWMSVNWVWVDTAVLLLALMMAAWLVLRERSRRGLFLLTLFSLAYFGFYREGCVCAVGSIQNVAQAAFQSSYALPWVVALFFALPLLFALFFGRVFCAGVCPLGAIQDVLLFKPLEVPPWLEAALGLFAYVYLGLAVLYAAIGSDFVICAYDPFVSFFRLSGSTGILLIGGALLVLSMFVGRVYCRFLCPYSVLLRLLSPLAIWKVRISPKACIDCKLCEKACPMGALDRPTRQTKKLDKAQVRRRALAAFVAVPVLVAVLATLGYAARGLLAQRDRTVVLAERVWSLQKDGKVKQTLPPDDPITAWKKTGESTQALADRARAIEAKFGLGGTLLGVWIGLAVGLRLVRFALPRKKTEYNADSAGCVACARCFESCPVEWERRGAVMPVELTVSATAPALAAEGGVK